MSDYSSTTSPPSQFMPPLDSLVWLQGSPDDINGSDKSALKLCLLIQPNCPGCHQAALPVLNDLYLEQQAAKKNTKDCPEQHFPVDIYVVSTAFEDFEYNTVESAKAMLEKQELVGVSQQALGSSAARYYEKLVMPVAHDIVVDKDKAPHDLIQLALDATKEQVKREVLSRGGIPHHALQNLLNTIDQRVLPEKIAHVFYSIRARGSPTWVLHRSNGQVLDQRLGPLSKDHLSSWIQNVACRSD